MRYELRYLDGKIQFSDEPKRIERHNALIIIDHELRSVVKDRSTAGNDPMRAFLYEKWCGKYVSAPMTFFDKETNEMI